MFPFFSLFLSSFFFREGVFCLIKKENETNQNEKCTLSRSRNSENRVSTLNVSRFDHHEDNAIATSESGSWAAEEKACSSDNQTSFMKGREFSER